MWELKYEGRKHPKGKRVPTPADVMRANENADSKRAASSDGGCKMATMEGTFALTPPCVKAEGGERVARFSLPCAVSLSPQLLV